MSEEDAKKKLVGLLAEAELDAVLDEVDALSPEARAKEDAAAGPAMDAAKRRRILEDALRARRKEKVEKEEKEPGGAGAGASADAKVVPLAPRKRTGPPWPVILAAAACAILALGYAWKMSRPHPEDDMANDPRHPLAPPSTAPSSPAPGLDIRGNPTADPVDDLVAHPPPKPCKPLPAGGAGTFAGTISREGERFVFVLDTPLCGPDNQSIADVDLEPANAKVDLAKFGIERIRVTGRVLKRDGGGLLVRVERAAGT